MRMMLAGLLGLALLTAPLRARAEPTGRAAKITSVAMWIASGVATAFGVIAYYETDRYERSAHNDLYQFTARTPAEQAFLTSPTCSPPASLATANPGATQRYLNDCRTGQSWSNAETAMLVLAPALAAGGAASWIVGVKQGERERERVTASLLPTGLRLTF